MEQETPKPKRRRPLPYWQTEEYMNELVGPRTSDTFLYELSKNNDRWYIAFIDADIDHDVVKRDHLFYALKHFYPKDFKVMKIDSVEKLMDILKFLV